MAMWDSEGLTQLVRSAGEAGAGGDRDAVFQQVVEGCVALVDGADHAGITVLYKRSVSTPVSTDPVVMAIDAQQYDLGEGPCLTAAVEKQPVVRVDDLVADGRWPAFSREAALLGVHAMLSFQLFTGEDTLGALNIYAGTKAPFTDESVPVGTLLAAHAATAALAASTSNNLRTALESRDTIGQAKGILMERHKITAGEAFELLVTESVSSRRKLRDVASLLTETGSLVRR